MGAEQKKQLTDLAAMLRQRKPSTE
jgi:hypothetical protein